MLIAGGYIHMFMFCPTSSFLNQIQIGQFEKKSVKQNRICEYTSTHPINLLTMALLYSDKSDLLPWASRYI